MPPHRQLLLIEPCKACLNVIPTLESCGWAVSTASLDSAAKRSCDVGLIRLRAENLKQPRMLNNLLSKNGAEWLAVVSDEDMQHTEVRNLIGEWFFDYHTLPLDPERMCITAGRAYGMAKVRKHASEAACQRSLIGDSKAIRKINALIEKVAPTDATVLIRGESGTGKELVARALHLASHRSNASFVPINCGAIPENLIQSELFGHEKGAFTGAHQRKIGRIEQAHGGTLLLDEIGDLPLELQANLLRFLQEGQIERVGSGQSINVDEPCAG